MSELEANKNFLRTTPEEEETIARARSGSSEAFAALAERYVPLIKKHVGRSYVPASERDDLMQEGLIGLLKAVRSYDCRYSSFATYASLCIKHSIISALRKYSRASCVYLSGSPLELTDCCEADGPEVDLVGREDVRALYETVFGILSPMERRVFELYLSGASYKAMAVSLGLGVKSVDNAVARIKAKIKRSVSIR